MTNEYIPSSWRRRVKESTLSGAGIGMCVSAERLVRQEADSITSALAGSIQATSTFTMAMISMSVYDMGVKKASTIFPLRVSKVLMGGVIGGTSGVVNRIGQSWTQGTIEESLVMSGISAATITAYEYKVLIKIEQYIRDNKYGILENTLRITNILGIR